MIKPFTLQEIGLKYGTDKATTHFYMDNYERHLGSWRDKEFTLLEIGVGNGSSIKMWREAFPKAKVYGIDINEDCAGDGIFIGNAIDERFLSYVLSEIGEVNAAIEDSSHVGDDMIQIFKFLFPKIKNGGYFFLEDTHTLYSDHYSGQFENNGRTKAYNFFTDLPYHVDIAGRAMCGNPDVAIDWPMPDPPVPEYSRILKSIHTYPSLWVYERK